MKPFSDTGTKELGGLNSKHSNFYKQIRVIALLIHDRQSQSGINQQILSHNVNYVCGGLQKPIRCHTVAEFWKTAKNDEKSDFVQKRVPKHGNYFS